MRKRTGVREQTTFNNWRITLSGSRGDPPLPALRIFLILPLRCANVCMHVRCVCVFVLCMGVCLRVCLGVCVLVLLCFGVSNVQFFFDFCHVWYSKKLCVCARLYQSSTNVLKRRSRAMPIGWNDTYIYTYIYISICICMHICMHVCI